ncbi:transposable element Tcb1 transposase [Trichonephila clavipes]|nr:transposable element Tcb1 transposase [Trichonephila clavipes]
MLKLQYKATRKLLATNLVILSFSQVTTPELGIPISKLTYHANGRTLSSTDLTSISFLNTAGTQWPQATGTTVSSQTVYRSLGLTGLYARRTVRCVPLTATLCRLQLTWSREHALWTPQQWSCGMFSDESRFSLQSDSRRTLIWRAPGTRYHQENSIERPRYGGAG